MNRKFKAIQTLLESGKFQVPNNKTWNEIAAEYDIGKPMGKVIEVSYHDREYLRNVILRETGIDPLGAKEVKNRIEMAKHSSNEKLFKGSVFGSKLQIATKYPNKLPINDISYSTYTPDGTCMAVSLEQIDTDFIDTLVIIENGSLMSYWDKINCSDMTSNALYVYRGHGSDSSMLRALQSLLKEETEVIGFFDYDPAGLKMAIDYGVDRVVVPDLDFIETVKDNDSVIKMDSWWEQKDQASLLYEEVYRGKCYSMDFCAHVETVAEERVAITQETMIAHDIPLCIVEV